MEIFINDQKLDSKLEQEQKISDVYDSVSKWLESNSKYMVSFLVDGKEVSFQEIDSMDIQSVNRLDFFIGEEIDILKSSLSELDKYIETVGNTLYGRDSLTEKESHDLMDGCQWMISILQSARTLLKLNYASIKPMGRGKNVEEILALLTELSQTLDTTSGINDFLENLRDLKLFVIDLQSRALVLDLDSEKLIEVIQNFTDNMEVLKSEFIQVNEKFQSGRDVLATEILMDSVGKLNTLMTALISLKGKIADLDIDSLEFEGEKLITFNQTLNDSLSLVAKALEDNDLVYAGDILEYELPSLLDRFVPYLRLILSKVNSTQI